MKRKTAMAVLLCASMLCSNSALAWAGETVLEDQETETEGTAGEKDYSFLDSAGGGNDEYTIGVLIDSMDLDTSDGTVFGDGYFTPSEETTTTTFPASYPRDMIYNISDEEIEEKTQALLKTLTFEEKVHLLTISEQDDPRYGSTSQPGYNSGVPRLGIPVVRMYDGPAGVNNYYYETTGMPLELLAASTFDPEMAYNYGNSQASNLLSVGGNWMLGTQFDVVRTPSWNRARDTYGEDYYLTGEMSIAETKGVQENGAMAMAKHMGAYSTNGDKNLNVEVDEQTLNTAYFYPFEMAAIYGKVSSIMTTYNRLNGIATSSNYEMQQGVVRHQWDFQGAMVPDWGGRNEFTEILGNTMVQTRDEENYVQTLLAVIESGLMTMDDVDELVSEVLYCYGVGGYLNLVEVDSRTGYAKEEPGRTDPIELDITYYDDRDNGTYDELYEDVKTMAEEGIVLTKNEDNALPLTEDDYTGDNSVALIGRYGSYYKSGIDGERSWGILSYQKSPYEGLTELLGEDANIVAEVMNEPYGDIIPAEYFYQDADGTENGLVRTYGILNDDYVEAGNGDIAVMLGQRLEMLQAQLEEDPENESIQAEIDQLTQVLASFNQEAEDEEEKDNTVVMEGYETGEEVCVDADINFTTGSERSYWNGEDGNAFDYGEIYTWKGYLKAPESGEYQFSIAQMGGTSTFSIVVDGEKQTAASSTASTRDAESQDTNLDGLVAGSVSVTLEEGQLYEVVITTDTTTGHSDYYDQAVELTWILPSEPEENLQAAYDAASSAKKVVYFTTAGTNTYDMAITDADTINTLADLTHENGGQFIVVFLNRTAFATEEGGWLDNCDAVLCAWYDGDAYGEAIADILTGEANPGGKLSLSFPKTSDETVITYDGKEVERGGDTTQQSYTAYYSEGINFGYRFYDEEDLEPGWAFGYGLSYTTFDISDLKVEAVDGEDDLGRPISYQVTVTVTNTGDVAGDEVVQVYVDGAKNAPDYVQTSEKQLCAFQRVKDLQPGESREVTMSVTTRMLSYWDTESELIEREDGTCDKWYLGTGERTFMVGNASDNLTLEETVEVA